MIEASKMAHLVVTLDFKAETVEGENCLPEVVL